MIHIIDYGVGNIQAFLNLFQSFGIESRRATAPGDLNDATRLLLPGVGSFDVAMGKLNASGIRDRLDRLVLIEKVPVLGVCVGMQMMANSSEEGSLSGLGWVPGRVAALSRCIAGFSLPLPHMGWNDVKPTRESSLFNYGFDAVPQFYFLHSYYFVPNSFCDVGATTCYGVEFASVVTRGHIHGIQCHPEKSHRWGGQLLRNFWEYS